MHYHRLNQQNNSRLIVFLAGWSFDFYPFEFLECENSDVLFVYDYNTINREDLELLKTCAYSEKFLISWSMGVYTAYLLKDKLPNFTSKIAVNGTPYPIDNDFGIPERTFDLTLKYAESGLQGKFYENVFSDKELLEKYLENPVKRTIQNRVNELQSLNELIRSQNITYNGNFYNKAIIGDNDKIIPTKNQIKMWGNSAKIINSGHFPFYNYTSWDEICK